MIFIEEKSEVGRDLIIMSLPLLFRLVVIPILYSVFYYYCFLKGMSAQVDNVSNPHRFNNAYQRLSLGMENKE